MMNFKLWLEAMSKEEALKDAKSAFGYARNVIGGRWPEGEATIAKHPEHAFWYAWRVIKGRWPEGEAVIATSPEYSYSYALNVIEGRWPEGEAAIAEDSEWAMRYAEDVVKGRWPEGEAAIAEDPNRPELASYYLKMALRPIYIRMKKFDDLIKHPDVVDLAKSFPLLQKVLNGSPKALRKFYMEIAPKHVRDMMLRYEP